MFLLILRYAAHHVDDFQPLHSNMFLLIRSLLIDNTPDGFTFTFQYVSINTGLGSGIGSGSGSFTFQYVSINTDVTISSLFGDLPLHSNMFLLIRSLDEVFGYQEASLHSNMFLLIRICRMRSWSILTTLHSNMFLLIR